MDQAEIDRLGRTFQEFLENVVHTARSGDDTVTLADRLETFLGVDPLGLPVVTEPFSDYEHSTIQVAIDRVLARPGVDHELVGIGGGGREHETLTGLLQMSRLVRGMGIGIGAVDYATVPTSVDDEMACVRFGMYLIDDGSKRLAVVVRGGSRMHDNRPMLEILATSPEDARAWLADLRAERAECNMLRGHVLSFQRSEFTPGAGPIAFHRRPDLSRADVVMDDDVLQRIERQVVSIAQHRERLASEGRHLKRGVLLYGPPGTGKTHTVRYLTGALEDFTVVLLAGPTIRFVSEACALARSLQPALIVLEDVDLVAEDRSFSHGGENPLLFTVLDEMDGLAGDSDVCFLLTTNRADMLETALAQRPGRVDLAVEIPLPDEHNRRRLVDIYGHGIDLSDDDVSAVVQRTEGVPASFIKELTRRATLLAAARGSAETTSDDVHTAAEELLNAHESLTRRLLGSTESGARASDGGASGGDGGSDWYATPAERLDTFRHGAQ